MQDDSTLFSYPDDVWREVVYPKRNGDLIFYDNYYEVNKEGVIRTTKYIRGSNHKPPGHILIQVVKKGYLFVSLKSAKRPVSRIVAYAFPEISGEPKPEFDVDHIDNNPLNNKAENLQWLSHKDNNGKKHHRDAISKKMKGVKKTEEHKRKIGEAQKGKTLSNKQKAALNKARSIPVNQYTLGGMLVANWSSALAAQNAGIADVSSIRRVCSGKQHTAGGYVWRNAN